MICQGSSDFLCSIQFPWPREHLGLERLEVTQTTYRSKGEEVTKSHFESDLGGSDFNSYEIQLVGCDFYQLLSLSYHSTKNVKKKLTNYATWNCMNYMTPSHAPVLLHPICDLPIKSWMSKWWIWRIFFGLAPPSQDASAKWRFIWILRDPLH